MHCTGGAFFVAINMLNAILSCRFSISHMMFPHIHYSIDFEFCRVRFVFSSCFAHKNMHLQMCLTFGVHIRRVLLWCTKLFSKKVRCYLSEIFCIIYFQ